MEIRVVSGQYDESSMRSSFVEWIEKGVFARKGIAHGLVYETDKVLLNYLSLNVTIAMRWKADAGSFNNREYSRDVNIYNDLQQRWQNSSHKGVPPRYPTRNDYMEWQIISGHHEDNYVFKELAGPFLPNTSESVISACTGISESVWSAWGDAKLNPDFDFSNLHFDQIKSGCFKEGSKKSYNTLTAKLESSWEKVRGIQSETDGNLENFDLIQYPVFISRYIYEDKSYAFVYDTYRGCILGGSRPKDGKKIGWAIAIAAALLVAVILAFYFTNGGRSTEKSNVMQNATAEVLNLSDDSARVMPSVESDGDTESEDSFPQKTTRSGLVFQAIVLGDGEEHPEDSDAALIEYTAKLADGTVFDKTSVPFILPVGKAIAGLSEGLKLMSKGDTFRFTIPSDLAYGQTSSGSVPANSTVIYEVKLIDYLPESTVVEMQEKLKKQRKLETEELKNDVGVEGDKASDDKRSGGNGDDVQDRGLMKDITRIANGQKDESEVPPRDIFDGDRPYERTHKN